MSRTQPITAIGLDVGTSRIVTAVPSPDGQTFQSQLNAFVAVPYLKLTETSLQRGRVPHSVAGDQIIVYGDESERMADLLGREVRRPMTRGLLNSNEPECMLQIQTMLGALLDGTPRDARLYFSVPAPALGSEGDLTYHEATMRQILEKLGFRETGSLNEGLAVIYAELEDSNYTGIGVSFGGGLCNVAAAYMSVPVLSFSIPKGGDFIDQSAANVTGETVNRIRMLKEDSFHLNGHYSDKLMQALTVYYDDMIQSVVDGLKSTFQSGRKAPKVGRSVPLVVSGGGVLPQGFRERFQKAVEDAGSAIPVSEVRLAESPLHTTAKGVLVYALSE